MWLWVAVALAHKPGLSYAKLDDTSIVLTFAGAELDGIVAIGDPRAKALIEGVTLGKASVSAGGARCTIGPATIQRVEADGLEVAAALDCPPSGEITLDAAYLEAFAKDHRHFVEVRGEPAATLDPVEHTVSFDGRPQPGAVAWRFFQLGIEHILTGWDHLAFVAALVLGARGWRQVLALVTSFTLAHSLTLALAVLGVVRLPSSLVEPAIAATIVFVAVENLWPPPFARRVALAFAFGLVHGLGFAGLLADLGLPASHLALALVTFNAGVEVGQVSAVCVLLAALEVVFRVTPEPNARRALSVALAFAGAWWLVSRLAGLGG